MRVPDFTIDVETPFQRALQGFETSRATRLKAEKEAAIQQQQQVLQNDLATLASKENPTGQDFTQLMIKHPRLSENIKRSYDLLTTEQQQVRLNDASELYSALFTGDVNVAKQIVEDRKEAAENSNLPGEVRKFEALIKLIEKDPEAAKISAGVSLSAVMGPDKFAQTFKTLTERPAAQETFRTLTDPEKKTLGLDTGKAFQMSSKGKISQIGKAGVSVNISQGKIGSIPPGYALKTGPEGELFMEPIKGGPVDKKLKEMAEKAKRTGELTQRAGDVVVEDIGRLRDKITNAPWYSPATGAVSQFLVPGIRQNSVDAAALNETIVANIGFDRLQQMRQASPTGGALGAVSERELSNLQSVMGSLSLKQSEKQLIKNLDRLEKIYGGILEKAKAYPNAEEFGFSETQETVTTEILDDQPVDQNIEAILERYRTQ